MKKVDSFGISSLKDGALIAFLKALIVILSGSDFFKSKYASVINYLQQTHDRLLQLHSRGHGSLLTDKLKEKDRHRDAVFTSLIAFIKMMSTSDNEAKREAGLALMKVKKAYGSVTSMSYTDESGTITAFLRDVRQFHAAEVETLGIAEMLNELEQANDEFAAVFAERNADNVALSKAEMPEARKEAIKSYRLTQMTLSLFYRIASDKPELKEQEEEVGRLIDLVNAEIKSQKISLALSRRGKKKEDEVVEDETVEDETVDNETVEDETVDNETMEGETEE